MVPTETPFTRALSSPHELINEIAQNVSQSADIPAAVSQAFQSAFPRGEALKKVPYLTTSNVDRLVGKTVRWTCMVQDNSLGNEIVLSRLPNGGCALFGGDSVESEQGVGEPSSSDLSERAILYATSLPGRTSWAAQADAEGSDLHSSSGASASASTSTSTPTANRGIKDKLPYTEDDTALGVMLKMYDLGEADALQVADIIEVVGILDQSAFSSNEWTGNESEKEQEETLVPSLHVVFHRKVTDVWSTNSDQASDQAHQQSNSSTTRNALITHLSHALQNDIVASEWLLLSLLSSIHTRKAPFALGHLSLRLLSSSSSSTSLHTTLTSLLPSVSTFPLTLSSLNSKETHLYPQAKPTSSTGLSSSLLQLPKSSTCIIDESISEGQLDQHGLTNLQSLQNVLRNSSLGYVFPYLPQPFEMPVDFALVVLSQGGSGGLVQCDVDVRVRPSGTDTQTETVDVQAFRRHISTARSKARTLQVPSHVAEAIQSHFVQSRKDAPASADTDLQATLLRHMDVARLLAASDLRDELTLQDYLRARDMDVERLRVLEEAKAKSTV